MIKRFKAIPPYRQWGFIIDFTRLVEVSYTPSFDTTANADPERIPSIKTSIRHGSGGLSEVTLTIAEYNEVLDLFKVDS